MFIERVMRAFPSNVTQTGYRDGITTGRYEVAFWYSLERNHLSSSVVIYNATYGILPYSSTSMGKKD
jgi:hypothetical protein